MTRVLAKLEPGGAQLSALRVVKSLVAHGLTSKLYVGWASEEGLELARRMDVDVEVYGRAGDLQWRADPGFARWLRPRLAGADVVHAHMFGAWWAAALAVEPGTVLVASEHNALHWPDGAPAGGLGAQLGRVDRFYAHGPGARGAMLDAGIVPGRLRAGLSPVADMTARARTDLPTPRIVFAGRLHAEKGPDVLLEALVRLPGAARALLLGAGPLEAQLAARIAAAGVGDRVQLCGWQRRPGRVIAGASVLVVPSRDESWSQTAVLGMALGVPVIGTDVDGLPATLGAGRGIIVAPDDPDALAEAIGEVLDGRGGTDLEGAREYAFGFTESRVAAAYAASYRDLHDDRLSMTPELELS